MKKINLHQAGEWLLWIAVFFLPTFQKISIFSIAALTLIWLAGGNYKNKFTLYLSSPYLKFLTLFYFLHVAGMIYSDNLDYGLRDLQTKFSFLLFPVVLPFFMQSRQQAEKVKTAFIAGCLAAAAACLAYAIIQYSKNDLKDYFYYTHFSVFIHPTYFAVYLNLAVIILIEKIFDSEFGIRKFIPRILILIFFLGSIFLLSGRTSIAVSIISILILIIIYVRQKVKLGIRFFVAGIILAAGIVLSGTWLIKSSRFPEMITTVQNRDALIEKFNSGKLEESDYNSLTERLIFWNCAFEVIRQNPVFGVGTGDLKEELIEVYKRKNFQRGIEFSYSPHNQFIHSSVILGAAGLIFLMLILIYPLIDSIRKKSYQFTLFLFIIILNCMTESLLEVQSGVMFFAVFYVLFSVENKKSFSTDI